LQIASNFLLALKSFEYFSFLPEIFGNNDFFPTTIVCPKLLDKVKISQIAQFFFISLGIFQSTQIFWAKK
jgi:hypothetical protein